jgi:Flp pilus assembly protein TadG
VNRELEHKDRRRSRAGSDEGASAVEFALVSPILFLLLFGIITFGIVFAQQLSLTNAARQGARVAVVNSDQRTCGELLAEVQGAAGTIGMVGDDVSVTVERVRSGSATTKCPDSSGYTPGQAAVVPCADSQTNDELRVSARFDSELGLFALVLSDSSITLTGVGVYRCEFS